MEANHSHKGTAKYISGEVHPFDQKNEVFKRARWDPTLRADAERFYSTVYPKNKKGYMLKDLALRHAAWYIEDAFAHGCRIHDSGLFSWETKTQDASCMPADAKLEIHDTNKISQDIKKVAKLFGASLVGITELDRRWIYSHTFNSVTHEYQKLEVPEKYQYAVVMAFEMDHTLVGTSPTWLAEGTEGVEYSRMPFATSMLAQFIRDLGYKAIPCGNDTALSIPLAIDAGLGELARNGLLITEEFGPRLRIAKVLTDLPLAPDKPADFGVTRFCEVCQKCAQNCPSQAIMHGERTTKPHNISNAAGELKWPINAEKCFAFWARNNGSCMNCIRVCPFNKPGGWLHDIVRWLVKDTPRLDSLLVKMDDLFGYGKQIKPDFWSE